MSLILTTALGTGRGGRRATAQVEYADIIVLTGQSNAVGQIENMSALPGAWLGPQDNIDIWWEGDYLTQNDNNGHFEPMSPPDNTRDPVYTQPGVYYNITGFGTEQGAAHALESATGRKIYVIKAAYGGTNITYWAKPAGMVWVKLERYITNAVAALVAEGLTPRFLGTLWMQGESDIIESSTAAYQGRLSTFIDNYREITPYLTDAPFDMAKLSDAQSSLSAGAGGRGSINGTFATMAATKSNCVVVDTDAYSPVFQSDFLHLTGASLINIGAGWANDYLL